MQQYYMFIDETDMGEKEFYFALALCTPKSSYPHWESQYKDLKRRFHQKGIIGSPNAQFHLREIKQHDKRGDFGALADPTIRETFWTELTAFVREMPFFLTGALVLINELSKATNIDIHLKTKMNGLSNVLENAAVAAQHRNNVSCYSVMHDWIQDDNYRDEATRLLGAIGSRGLRHMHSSQVKDMFDPTVTWIPKKQKSMGVELTDLMANPILASYLGRPRHQKVAEQFGREALGRLVLNEPERWYCPFAVRLIP